MARLSVSAMITVPAVHAVGAADVESMRLHFVLPATDGLAVGEVEAEGPCANIDGRRRQALTDEHLLPHAKFGASNHVGDKAGGGGGIGVAHVSVVLGVAEDSRAEPVP